MQKRFFEKILSIIQLEIAKTSADVEEYKRDLMSATEDAILKALADVEDLQIWETFLRNGNIRLRIPELKPICEQLGPLADLSCTEKILLIRDYVARSQILPAVDGFLYPSLQMGEILASVYAAMNGGPGAPLFCQASMLAMSAILACYGIRFRHTAILTTHCSPGIINSHAILEVLNEDVSRWEIHDPTYGVAYGATDSMGKPLSAMDFFLRPAAVLRAIEGPSYFPHRFGELYETDPLTSLGKDYPEALVAHYLSDSAWGVINMSRADMSRRFPEIENRNLVEYLNYVYRQPQLIGFDGERFFSFPDIQEHFEPDIYLNG